MIPSGLKVGDTFTDNGKYYEVLEVVPAGYISKMVEKPAEKPVEKNTEVAEKKPATRGRKKS